MKYLLTALILLCSSLSICSAADSVKVELSAETLLLHYSSATAETFKGREAIHLKNTPAHPNGPVALIKGVAIENAIIEVDIASERFAGIAFRSQDGDHYEKVYFRPFNSGTDKHLNSVQYAVMGNTSLGWNPLRKQFPGTFESGADVPVMEWFRAKLVIDGGKVEVFVNDGAEPVLVIDQTLSGYTGGGVGIWGWNAYFANFEYTPLPKSKPLGGRD